MFKVEIVLILKSHGVTKAKIPIAVPVFTLSTAC